MASSFWSKNEPYSSLLWRREWSNSTIQLLNSVELELTYSGDAFQGEMRTGWVMRDGYIPICGVWDAARTDLFVNENRELVISSDSMSDSDLSFIFYISDHVNWKIVLLEEHKKTVRLASTSVMFGSRLTQVLDVALISATLLITILLLIVVQGPREEVTIHTPPLIIQLGEHHHYLSVWRNRGELYFIVNPPFDQLTQNDLEYIQDTNFSRFISDMIKAIPGEYPSICPPEKCVRIGKDAGIIRQQDRWFTIPTVLREEEWGCLSNQSCVGEEGWQER